MWIFYRPPRIVARVAEIRIDAKFRETWIASVRLRAFRNVFSSDSGVSLNDRIYDDCRKEEGIKN